MALNELKYIFALLGAKSIKWKILDKKDENNELSGKVNVSTGAINGGLGFENNENNSDLFKNEGIRTFPDNKIVPNNTTNTKSINYRARAEKVMKRTKSRISPSALSYYILW